MKIFQNRLKEAMKTAQVSQSELARRVGVKQQSVWEWLNKCYPSVDSLIKICVCLKANPTYLLGLENKQGIKFHNFLHALNFFIEIEHIVAL